MDISDEKIEEFCDDLLLESYIDEVLEFCSGTLYVLAQSKDSVLACDAKGKMFYFYMANVNENFSLQFNLLSEVGQKYQLWFELQIEKLGLVIVQKDKNNDYYDKAKKKSIPKHLKVL
jgi:hypothetical protein